MIPATVTPIANYQVQLTVHFPDGKDTNVVLPNSRAEVEALMYFYNRLYICVTLEAWLIQRRNVFLHVEDPPRHRVAIDILNKIEDFRLLPLAHVCAFVTQQELNIKYLAPKDDSRYYAKYRDEVLPVLQWCREAEGETLNMEAC